MDDNRCQNIAIGHLSDSGDLIKILITNSESPKKIFKTTSNADMEKLFEARQAPNIKRTTSWGFIFQGKYLFRKILIAGLDIYVKANETRFCCSYCIINKNEAHLLHIHLSYRMESGN